MNKTYAVSDLHGYVDLYNQIKEFVSPGDTIYYLGDAIDRGPQPWELAKIICDDEQFIYLKGNHEDMLVKAALNYFGDEWDTENSYYDLLNNGGIQTWDDMINDEKNIEYINKLKALPKEKIYLNKEGKEIHLCHAGYTPGKKEDLLWGRAHMNDIVKEADYVVVHGHTPTLHEDGLYPNFYANGYKVNIDMGTVMTKSCCLLDLDTFKYYMFKIKE